MKLSPRWLAILFLIVLVVLLVFVMRPSPVEVDVALVQRQSFTETVEEQGRTRARNPFTITAPISGRLLRTELDEGHTVTQGQVIARIAPSPQDQRSQAFAEASLASAQARYQAAQAALGEARSTYSRAVIELERREQLFNNNLTSVEEVDTYRQAANVAESRVQAAEAGLATAQAEIESARTLFIGVDSTDLVANARVNVLSPSDGTVYRVYEENERVIQAGTPIFQISNQDNLEIVVDLLTQEAVRIKSGDPVRVTGWGGDYTIDAVVKYIEPEAFTKISALGVEEQRVNVIAEILDVPDNIGAEYRVEVAIVTWQGENVLTIPTSAIFQRSSGWNTFVVSDGIVEQRPVQIGSRGRDFTQVIGGVEEGEAVVIYPSDLINEGTRVAFQATTEPTEQSE